MRAVRRDAAVEAGRLLRVLLLRFSAVSADPGGAVGRWRRCLLLLLTIPMLTPPLRRPSKTAYAAVLIDLPARVGFLVPPAPMHQNHCSGYSRTQPSTTGSSPAGAADIDRGRRRRAAARSASVISRRKRRRRAAERRACRAPGIRTGGRAARSADWTCRAGRRRSPRGRGRSAGRPACRHARPIAARRAICTGASRPVGISSPMSARAAVTMALLIEVMFGRR